MGEKIRALREAKGMTQAELAEALGLSQPAIVQWETGKNEPTAFNIRRLADLFGVPPGDLF